MALDCFAIMVTRSAGSKHFCKTDAFVLSFIFAFLHAIFPFIGWLIGKGLESIISNYVNLIAGISLLGIGLKMLYDIFLPNKESGDSKHLNIKEMLLLGVLVSIDSLGAGFPLSLTIQNPFMLSLVFFVVTLLLSLLGLLLGSVINKKYSKIADFIGALILIIVGISILF
jgi:putative Mn2+ efflux pump MntP